MSDSATRPDKPRGLPGTRPLAPTAWIQQRLSTASFWPYSELDELSSSPTEPSTTGTWRWNSA